MNGKRKKILIVDDDPMAAAAVQRPLAMAGCDTVTIHSGAEALEWLRYETPDLILLDVAMPGLSGLEVCERLRQEQATRSTPVIFLTAKNRIEDLIQGQKAGSDLYLTKPVGNTRLLNMVGMFLSSDAPPLVRKPSALAGAP